MGQYILEALLQLLLHSLAPAGDVCKLHPGNGREPADAATSGARPPPARRRLRGAAPAAATAQAPAPAAAAAAAASGAAGARGRAGAQAAANCGLDCSPPPADDPWAHPPYQIANGGGGGAPLGTKTVAVTARHRGGALHYDTHNLYGMSEAAATAAAVGRITRRRPFVLSRSTFPGAGRHAAHWSGDNAASWDDLRWSVQGLINANLWGIPLAGGPGGGGVHLAVNRGHLHLQGMPACI